MDGDRELARAAGGHLGARHPVFAAALVTPETQRVACVGAGLDADFEIGSITKGVTGLLYAEALARKEITPDTTVGDLLPVGQVPAAGVTLGSLSTHHSGLPRIPSAGLWRKTFALWRHGANPYGETLAEVLGQLGGVRLKKPRFRYSNLGYELLGHALAGAARTSYPELLRTRITEPLGLNDFYLPEDAARLRAGALTGRTRSGKPRDPWLGEAVAPAGGVRATIGDMAAFAAALLRGTAPGMAALEPVASLAGEHVRIGAGWLVQRRKGQEITWHNGGTGGFRSFLGMDRSAGTGVVVLSATAVSVDRAGFALLAGE